MTFICKKCDIFRVTFIVDSFQLVSKLISGAHGPEKSQPYRQSLSPDFYVKRKIGRFICALFRKKRTTQKSSRVN